MKKIILILVLSTFINSCAFNLEETEFNFDNFKDTPVWELAKAVRADDENEINNIVKNNKLNIDFKDPIYNQTLLALSIQNEKRNAFLALLKAGANPNVLVGDPKDATPFIYGIKHQNFDCELFYTKTMLNYGADPNLEIQNPTPEYFFSNSFPLLAAIGFQYNGGKDCLDLIKLLVDHGANINCCYKDLNSNLCEGVIAECLTARSLETLKYFVIEKKITVPNIVIVTGLDKSTQKFYGLEEMLKTKEFNYEDFEMEGKKYDRSEMRKMRDEILDYLDKNKK